MRWEELKMMALPNSIKPNTPSAISAKAGLYKNIMPKVPMLMTASSAISMLVRVKDWFS